MGVHLDARPAGMVYFQAEPDEDISQYSKYHTNPASDPVIWHHFGDFYGQSAGH
jgi:hypothetical protein